MNRSLRLWLLVSLVLPIGLFAQTDSKQFTVSGKLIDSSSREALTYATISLLGNQKELLASTYSDERGNFKFEHVFQSASWLEISSTGYTPLLLPLYWKANSNILSLEPISLAVLPHNLATVTVSGRKRIVEQRPGMLVYRAGNDPSNQGGTAADVLRKAPVLSVDAQGNVSMRGSGNIRILINGKFSGQMARNPADALNMIPASIIESVEIITTPSVKYDAEGTAGVINIITKKSGKDYTGSVEFSGSNMAQMINPRFEFTAGKWNFSFHGHLHRLRSKEDNEYTRVQLNNGVPGASLFQQTKQDNGAPHGSADIALVFTPDSLTEWSLAVNTRVGNWPGDSYTATSSRTASGQVAEYYQQYIDTREQYIGTDINLSYSRHFAQAGREITLQMQYSPGNNESPYQSKLYDIDNQLFYEERNDNIIHNNEWTLQADYVHPFNEMFTLESGLKAIIRSAENTYAITADDGAGWVTVEDRSDRFSNSQNVFAGYSLLKATLSKKWYVETGLRLEGTNMNGSLDKAGTNFGRNFFNLIPTATITRKLNADQNMSLSYTKRITRPFIFDMNPNVNASDPKNLESGNPDLAPELTHQVEMVHGLNKGTAFFLNSSIYWRKTVDAIVEYTNTDVNGISLTRKENLAGNRSVGLNLSATSMLAPWCSINSNVNINHLKFESDALAVVRDGWATDLDLNGSFKLPKRITLQAAGAWNSRKVNLQGYASKQFYYSTAVKKEWAKPKLALTLLAINPFSTSIAQEVYMESAQFRSYENFRYYLREFKLTLNWEFGSQLNARDRKKINNNDVNGSGKG